MVISDDFLLTYVLGTAEDIKEHLRKKDDEHAFDSGYMVQGLFLGPLLLFGLCPPAGMVIEADFFYRMGMRMFSERYKDYEPPSLMGKVRELYKAMKS